MFQRKFVTSHHIFDSNHCIDMSCILHIESSTQVCSVALSENGTCIYKDFDGAAMNHAKVLAPMVRDTISFADSHAIPIDAVAISMGPGSYTGLRIGVSEAKGICYGRDLPLIAIPTLEIMCVPILLYRELEENALLCPMIDARRMEVYATIYDRALKVVRPTTADVVDPTTYGEFLEKGPVYFFGNGAEKCQREIQHPNAHFIDNIVPDAKYMFPLAEKAWATKHFEDVAYFEPFYLKQFVATKPKKLI